MRAAQQGRARANRQPRKRGSVWASFAAAVLLIGGAFAVTVWASENRLFQTLAETIRTKEVQPLVDQTTVAEILTTDPDYGILYREIKRKEPEVFQALHDLVAGALADGADVDSAKTLAQIQVETVLQKYWSNASDPVVFQRLIVDSKLYDHFFRVKPTVCVKLWNARPLGSDSQLVPAPLQEQIISTQVGLLQDFTDVTRPGLSNEQTVAAASIVWERVAQELGRDLSIVNDIELQNQEPAALCRIASVFNSAVRVQLNQEFVAPLIRQLTRAMQNSL